MKTSELRSESATNIKGKIVELQKELVKLNAQRATGAVPKSPSQIRNTRRSIARMKGILREQQLNTLAEKEPRPKQLSSKQKGARTKG